MREFLLSIASLAGAVIMSALSAIIRPESPLWKTALWGAAGIFLSCAILILFDFLRPGTSRVLLIGFGLGLAITVGFGLALYFEPITAPASDQRQQTNLSERVPLISMVEKARKVGWNVNTIQSNDVSDLTGRLNQAAADGTLKFWGRKYEYDLSETAVTNFPLVEIPAEHFKEFSFQPTNLFRDQQRNFYISTGKLGKQSNELRGKIYRDIHVCLPQLVEWLSHNTKIS